jgi:hypothetical protein
MLHVTKAIIAVVVGVVAVNAVRAQTPAAAPKAGVKELRLLGPEGDILSPGGHPVLYATYHHFASTQSLLKEMKSLNAQAYHSGMVIKWYETYATKIDELPVVNVDEEMLDYSARVSEKLRSLAASLRGSNDRINVLDSYTRSSVWVQQPYLYYDWWVFDYRPGFVITETNAPEVRTAKSEVAAKGREDRTKLSQSIDSDTAGIRRAMSVKYRVEFAMAK